MFSGIVETTSQFTVAVERTGVLQCTLKRPANFDDVKIGDSIALDGICLTLEKFDEKNLIFALGPETLRITGWTKENLLDRSVNVERSLRLNDRIHGHLVNGHVDAKGVIKKLDRVGESLTMTIGIPSSLAAFVWPKGSIAVNGVSLTINAADQTMFQVGLIPETLKRTNLGQLNVGDEINLEIDNMARGLVHFARQSKEMQK